MKEKYPQILNSEKYGTSKKFIERCFFKMLNQISEEKWLKLNSKIGIWKAKKRRR